ncbi:MAG: alpha amylase C-terminal domain-containing protein [Desulfobacterales bacterium]|nr:alpha amylase C-terminal domain-containing protein [Desulfobacterales bacterium]
MNNRLSQKLLELDPLLKPYAAVLNHRLEKIDAAEKKLTGGEMTLADFASGHEYFGLHRHQNEWIFREWAPNARAIFLVGDLSSWQEEPALSLQRIADEGVWEIRLPPDRLRHGDLYRLRIYWADGSGDRIPVYARRVVQDPESLIFNAQVWQPPDPYLWQCRNFLPPTGALFIYEAHVGMAQEEGRVGTYREFTEKILPRIVSAGYNTLQLMAIPEHPYYASFGYHVSSFFAVSSRFGTPAELKALIDAAHLSGIRVIMDLIHSHAVSNEVEGLSRFDGTPYQFFHEGQRGVHAAWDSRLFDYSKHQVLHFLLSNCRYWLDEYRVDGFRFDGITSMLYTHHGLGKAFTSYNDYFGDDVDEDALAYLALANRVIHAVRPDAVSIAEDVSGMPGLALSQADGGFGFDYRFNMGVPDYWIKLTKETRDEAWPMGQLWHELTNRRGDEHTLSYAESHDQALVGDQTLIFRLIGQAMYDHMQAGDPHMGVDRGMALIKLIRLITMTLAGGGYLNFMGNEFGHPDWIDFPRQGNNWSYHYARRQWHLADDPNLKYQFLLRFDRDMIALAKQFRLLETPEIQLRHEHSDDKILAFSRAGLLFVFNFHPAGSRADYRIGAPPGKYVMVFDSDAAIYGGHGRVAPDQFHFTLTDNEKMDNHYLSLYLPNRTAIALKLL